MAPPTAAGLRNAAALHTWSTTSRQKSRTNPPHTVCAPAAPAVHVLPIQFRAFVACSYALHPEKCYGGFLPCQRTYIPNLCTGGLQLCGQHALVTPHGQSALTLGSVECDGCKTWRHETVLCAQHVSLQMNPQIVCGQLRHETPVS